MVAALFDRPRLPTRDPFDLLPLRQVVRPCGEAAPAFARQALLDGLSRPVRFRISRYGEGGQIRAVSEQALAEARAVLRQAYGELVSFGAPTVHTYVDAQREVLMEPVMFMRIDAPKSQRHELLALLQERGAELLEVDQQRHRVVVRAEIRLARLLGLEHEIQALGDGSAHVLCWLLRYDRASA
jgi:hypothetical protein